MDEKIKEALNRLNNTEEQPQNNQTDTETRLTELEQAFDALLNGVTDDE